MLDKRTGGVRTGEARGGKLQRLLHELRTHQIELEIQNEELRKTQIELEDAKNRYADLYDFAPVAYFTLDRTGIIREANLAGASLLGVERARLIGSPFGIRLKKDSYDVFFCHLARVLKTGRPQRCEIELMRKDGEVLSADVESIPAGLFFCRSAVIDITERKKIEKELQRSRDELEKRVEVRTEELRASRRQLRELAAHLQAVWEEERAHFTREIHDGLGQTLTVLKMDVSWLSKQVRDNPPLFEKTKSMLDFIDASIRSVKRIMTELRPEMLDHLGIVAAIEWLTRDFEERTGIACEFTSHPEEIRLDTDLATTIFRIFQEALMNVARHAGATKVIASIESNDTAVVLKIADNGRGITKKQLSDPASFGLIGIRERAFSYYGEASIEGGRKRGTTVTVSIPLNRGKNGRR